MTNPQPTRRSLARGAAWSIPAVAVAASAPAMAASATNCLTTSYDQTFSGTVQGGVYIPAGCCLQPGQVITVTFTNNGSTAVSMDNNNSSSLWQSSPSSAFSVAPGATRSITYTYVGGKQCSGTVKYNTYLSATPAGSVFTSQAVGADSWTHAY